MSVNFISAAQHRCIWHAATKRGRPANTQKGMSTPSARGVNIYRAGEGCIGSARMGYGSQVASTGTSTPTTTAPYIWGVCIPIMRTVQLMGRERERTNEHEDGAVTFLENMTSTLRSGTEDRDYSVNEHEPKHTNEPCDDFSSQRKQGH